MPNYSAHMQLNRATHIWPAWALRQSSSTLCGVCHKRQTPVLPVSRAGCTVRLPSSPMSLDHRRLLRLPAHKRLEEQRQTPLPTILHTTASFSFVPQGLATIGLLNTPQAPGKCIPSQHGVYQPCSPQASLQGHSAHRFCCLTTQQAVQTSISSQI